MYLSDLMSVKQWLIEKELLVPDPSPEEYEKSVDWVRRHLFVPLYTHKRGYAQVSKAAIENAYKIKKKFLFSFFFFLFLGDSVKVRINKERAAVQLNAKNMAYKGVFSFDTKANRDAFFASPEGYRFFFACLVYTKPQVLLPQEGWVFVKPEDKLKQLVMKYKESLKLDPYVWSLILEIPYVGSAPVAQLSVVAASPDLKGTTAQELKDQVKAAGASRNVKLI